jgi:hypothetical protein
LVGIRFVINSRPSMDNKQIAELAPKQLDRVLAFFSRVEAKASFVFAMNSALLGVMAVHVHREDFKSWTIGIGLAAFGIVLSVSYYFVFESSFPRLAGGQSSLVYFKRIAELREEQFVKQFSAQSEEQLANDMLCQVWRNSQILTAKFHAVKIAFFLTGCSLAPWTFSLVLIGAR